MPITMEELINLESFYVNQIKANFSNETEDWFELYNERGILSGALTMWLMLLQAINDCSETQAVQLLQKGCADLVLQENSGSKKANNKEITTTSGGYNKAKNRLPVITVEETFEVVNKALMKGKQGPKTAILDGSGLVLSCGMGIEAEFPLRGNGKRQKLYYPEMRIVFATDLETGIAVCPEYGPMGGKHAVSETGLSRKVLDRLDTGTTVIADRGFGIFSVVSHCVSTGKDCVVRLTSLRAGKVYSGKEKEVDREVVWEKSPQDHLLDDGDDTKVRGRFIRKVLCRDGYRPIILMLFTTVMDASTKEIVDLYGQRLHVETDIRYLKNRFGISKIISKSTSMIRKELLMRMMSYNMLKKIVALSAIRVGLEPRQVSFDSVSAFAVIFGNQILEDTSRLKQKELLARFLDTVKQSKLYKRKGRHEPRMITHKKDKFLFIKSSRAEARAKSRDS